ncbi:hypothetical protein FB45DRAFT_277364, partial [Roridomyces roridus]
MTPAAAEWKPGVYYRPGTRVYIQHKSERFTEYECAVMHKSCLSNKPKRRPAWKKCWTELGDYYPFPPQVETSSSEREAHPSVEVQGPSSYDGPDVNQPHHYEHGTNYGAGPLYDAAQCDAEYASAVELARQLETYLGTGETPSVHSSAVDPGSQQAAMQYVGTDASFGGQFETYVAQSSDAYSPAVHSGKSGATLQYEGLELYHNPSGEIYGGVNGGYEPTHTYEGNAGNA